MNTPTRRRHPLVRGIGGGAVIVSLGVHGAGAALAMLVLPHALGSSRGEAAAARPQPVEIDFVSPLGASEPVELTAAGRTMPEASARPASHDEARRALRLALRTLAKASAPPRNSPALAASSSSAAPAAAAPTEAPAPEPAATATLVAPGPDAPPPRRFALAAGNVASRGSLTAASLVTGAERASGDPGNAVLGSVVDGRGDRAAFAEALVDVRARLRTSGPLVYPEEARRAEVEMDLPLELEVSAGGQVQAARALAHPGYGLEEAALRAVRAYLFHPALRAGHPVAVRMRWVVQFRLR